jgi:hypothetical protein
MLLVGGRSDTYGVLSSAELVTSGGVCRGAVPPLPAMRWKAIAAALDSETVVVCGGINFLGKLFKYILSFAYLTIFKHRT